MNNYALRCASKNGYYKTVKLLLKYGADVHAINDYALQKAFENGHDKITKLLRS